MVFSDEKEEPSIVIATHKELRQLSVVLLFFWNKKFEILVPLDFFRHIEILIAHVELIPILFCAL